MIGGGSNVESGRGSEFVEYGFVFWIGELLFMIIGGDIEGGIDDVGIIDG